MKHIALWSLTSLSLAAGCADDGKRPIGATCESDGECESGLCLVGVCLDPSADDDLDGLTNQTEAALGSSPHNADSDYDGLRDGAEVSPRFDNLDSDGDGKPDIRESALLDFDRDCLVDQLDADDGAVASDLSPMRALVCPEVGVCAGAAAATITCGDDRVARCELGAVADWEATEATCDGRDNDCDGLTDEGQPDSDGDGRADCVDDDRDNDSVASVDDNCPEIANPSQEDADDDGVGDACDPPGPVAFAAFEPPSPAASRAPEISGTTEALLELSFFADPKCEVAIGAGASDAAGRYAVALDVPADQATAVFLRAVNRAGLVSECRPTGAVFVNDGSAPPEVALDEAPPSPTRDATVELAFAPATEAVTIDLYQVAEQLVGRAPLAGAASCEGSPLRSVTVAAGAAPVELVTLVPDRLNTFYGRARDLAGNASACAQLTMVIHDAAAPEGAVLSSDSALALTEPHGGDAIFEVGGCAEVDATVRIYRDRQCAGAPVAVLDTDSDVDGCDTPGVGGWTAALPVTADASTAFWIEVEDLAGNSSGCLELGTYVHDGVAPGPVGARAIRGTSWGEGVATFTVEGDAEEWAAIELSLSPSCQSTAATASGGPLGRFVADVTAFAATPELFAQQRDRAGNRGPCTRLGVLFGDVTLTLSTRGKPRVAAPVVVSAPDGSLLGVASSDRSGVATATIVAGCGLTAVTYDNGGGYYQWTTVLGLVPGQALALEVDDGAIDETADGLYLGVSVPEAPDGAAYYRVLTPCGADYRYFEGTPVTAFETWYDPACSATGDLTLIVEALDDAGTTLGYLAAMDLALPLANGGVAFEGPWRTDLATFTLTIEPGATTGPFWLTTQFGHHAEVLMPFGDGAAIGGFAVPGESTDVIARLPNIEHASVDWRLEVDHLGVDGIAGTRGYTSLGTYVPGKETIALDGALLPRVYDAAVDSGVTPRRVRWQHEGGLAASTDALLADVYLSWQESVQWRFIGRPADVDGFALPVVPVEGGLPGAASVGAEAYVQLESVTWFDWATVAGFDAWVAACSGVDLGACVAGLAETVTRTSRIGGYRGDGR